MLLNSTCTTDAPQIKRILCIFWRVFRARGLPQSWKKTTCFQFLANTLRLRYKIPAGTVSYVSICVNALHTNIVSWQGNKINIPYPFQGTKLHEPSRGYVFNKLGVPTGGWQSSDIRYFQYPGLTNQHKINFLTMLTPLWFSIPSSIAVTILLFVFQLNCLARSPFLITNTKHAL